ncbi:C40 family peptidase [uncultured Pontibacter sp.]|uniref:C40 family peptidase n=1 Tax=uncultured Pontibacter sp. TaxID=453356 RepID=UPI002635D709|nr:C40 family peptidase [uncultured Pontibacter sp.]
MKKIFALIAAPVVLLLFIVFFMEDDTTTTATEITPVHFAVNKTERTQGLASIEEKITPKSSKAKRSTEPTETTWYDATGTAPSDTLIAYALSLIGTPYVYGGTTSGGFDCSGFTSHVFQEFDVPITRSSTTQSQDGIPVDREEARPGDLVVFTGTNPDVREPGHVGIVISEPGDVISFVHSSSNGGVKVSQVEGTGYEIRFLGIRRVI